MEDKIVLTRKEHKCDNCGKIIPKKTLCIFFSGKAPRFDNDDNGQIGIEYYKGWLCGVGKECMEGI